MSYIKRRLRDNRIILIRGVYTNMPYKIALKKFAYIICFFMFLLFPTSINSIPHSVKSIIVLWILESAVIVFFICEEKIDKKQLLKTMVIIGYLMIATIVATRENALYISLARIAPILCFVVMCCTNVKSRIQPSFFLGLLDTMCIILIVWNFLTLMKEPHFIKFVNLFYTQLDSYTATYWSLTKNRPVFTFGVHNFAAIFYLHFFLFCYFAYTRYKRYRYWIYMVCIWLFTMLLKTTSGIGVFCFMALFILRIVMQDKKKIFSLMIWGCLALLFLKQPSFLNDYTASLTSKANGFSARYASESNLYEGNWSILKRFPLGIGVHIGRPELNIYFADSGYAIYLTMGNLVVLLSFFELMFCYLRNNLGLKMALILFVVIALTELSFVSFMYDKTLYLYVFEIGFYRSILVKTNSKEREFTASSWRIKCPN